MSTLEPAALRPAAPSALFGEAPPSSALRSEARSAIKKEQGPRLDARAFLDAHPELAEHREVVVELAFEEYCQRLASGETVDGEAFVARFPEFKSTVKDLLQTVQHMGPDLVREPASCLWPKAGDNLLGFLLEREIGRGGLARVFLAREAALGHRAVVVKISLEHGVAEASILGRLEHENIVPVHSIHVEPASGGTIVCMPYFGQTTLHDVLDQAFSGRALPRRGRVILEALARRNAGSPISMRQAPSRTLTHGSYVDAVVDLGIQLAEALAFVHERKIFHCDLKPSNVLIGPDGRPRLLDFNLSAHRTREPVIGGTLTYMPPEQLRLTDANYAGPPLLLEARSDLFALGVMLYELLTGRHPFAPMPWTWPLEELRQWLLTRIPAGPQPLRRWNPHVDGQIAQAIERCLADTPEQRIGSAGELARELRRHFALQRRAGRWLARHGAKAAAVGAAAGGILAAFLLLREPYAVSQLRRGRDAFDRAEYAAAAQYLTQALQANAPADQALFWRGRARLRLGDSDQALADFTAADQLQPTGPLRAAMAYCVNLNKAMKAEQAAKYYQDAIARGFATARVYNNLGVTCAETEMMKGHAWDHFTKAIELDGNLQAARYNRAVEDLNRAFRPSNQEHVPLVGLADIDRAIELGPPSGKLYVVAVNLYALADMRRPNPAWQAKITEYVRKAVEHGVPAIDFSPSHNLYLKRFKDEPWLQEALRAQPVLRTQPAALRLEQARILDPLEGMHEAK